MVGHYIIGIVLSVFYVVATGFLGVAPGGFVIAVGYGLATCVFRWFLVLPALGFGVFGVKGPPELKLFTASVLNPGCGGARSCSSSPRGWDEPVPAFGSRWFAGPDRTSLERP